MATKRDRTLMIAGGAALGLATLALLAGEKKRPLRKATQAEPARTLTNLALGAMSMATVALVEAPLTKPLSQRAERKRKGLVQACPCPPGRATSQRCC